MRLALALTALALLTGCDIDDFGPSSRYQADFHYNFDVNPGVRIDAESFNGPIEIEGWDQNRVEITGVKYASSPERRDDVRIETHNMPDSVSIRAIRPVDHFGNSGARYQLRVPKTAQLDRITTSNGHIDVHEVASAAYLKTSNAHVSAADLKGPLDVHTTNGWIEATGIKGEISLKTSNARIRAESVSGRVEAITSNGPIDMTLRQPPKERIHAETSNGGITLRLPADTAADLRADTSNSSIRTDFDVTTRFTGDRDRRRHVEGKIGPGGPAIELSTSNGHITLSKT